MNIALVIERLKPSLGGAEQWTWQYAHHLTRMGHEVHVVAREFDPLALENGLILHPVQGNTSRRAFADSAAETLQRLSVALVHDMGAGWNCDVFQPHGGSRSAAFEQNLRRLSPWHRGLKQKLSPLIGRYREFHRLAARQYVDDGRVFVALSQMVARHFTHYHHVSPQRIRLVYNGVDAQHFSPQHRGTLRATQRSELGLDPDDVMLLIVAHNFELKGVPQLIRAAGQLRQRGHRVHLTVVGGKRTWRYQPLVEYAGAEGHVTFVGPVEDARPYYAAGDLYVHPTMYDPCSLVVLEAMASGLPVITTRFNGAAELMTPGRDGYVLDDPTDVDALANHCEDLLCPRRRTAMGNAARASALQHPLEGNFQQLVAIYESVLEGKATFRRKTQAGSHVRPRQRPLERPLRTE
jgi:UDP-glucose:(heptosyl)LPS alpha-1,3-glucosyltransferase